MARRLVMHRYRIGPGAHERFYIAFGVFDHEVAIEMELGDPADGLDHRRPDGQVGDEMAVHDIQMEEARTRAFDLGDVLGQARKVRREDGWDDFNHLRAKPDFITWRCR